MRAWPRPQTAILNISVLEEEQQTDARLPRRRVKKRAVLVRLHLLPNVRLLEDVHGLWEARCDVSEITHELSDRCRV